MAGAKVVVYGDPKVTVLVLLPVKMATPPFPFEGPAGPVAPVAPVGPIGPAGPVTDAVI